MFKFTCLLLYAVAVSLSDVAGDSAENFREATKPFVMKCAEEHGISEADLVKAKETHKVHTLEPCFIGCTYKKFKFINDKGEHDMEAHLANINKFVKHGDHLAQLSDIVKKCNSVNDESVSDGTAGCERAVLLLECFMRHNSEIPI